MDVTNIILIALGILALLAFIYFVIRRNYKDQKAFERELNQKELKPDKHSGDKV